MVVANVIFLFLSMFVSSAIVLGLTAYLLHVHTDDGHIYVPFSRLIYSAVIAAISVVLSATAMIPKTIAMAHLVTDLLLAGAWFAVFAVLQYWYDTNLECGGHWNWTHAGFWRSICGHWVAVQAFSFLAAVLWFASFVLGLPVWARANKGIGTTATQD
ncbi:hypothetical protein GQ44DRAFT_565463, partial [Phaeosphaeriaceae sp. PMI808]